jgi:hypothetical protein
MSSGMMVIRILADFLRYLCFCHLSGLCIPFEIGFGEWKIEDSTNEQWSRKVNSWAWEDRVK